MNRTIENVSLFGEAIGVTKSKETRYREYTESLRKQYEEKLQEQSRQRWYNHIVTDKTAIGSNEGSDDGRKASIQL